MLPLDPAELSPPAFSGGALTHPTSTNLRIQQILAISEEDPQDYLLSSLHQFPHRIVCV